MKVRKHIFGATWLIGLVFAMTGCNGGHASPNAVEKNITPQATPAIQATAGPAQPVLIPSPMPEGSVVHRLLNTCYLIDSRDLAGLFSTGELEGPVHKTSQVNRLSFSTESVSASESSCIYYEFHKPGSKDMSMLQATYWVDVPDQTTPSAWAQVWADARSKTMQAVPGIGDDAFYDNGRLTFRKGSIYVTLEAVGVNVNLEAGANQQLEIEKQLALDMLSRLE
jgi:hypothetical protein